MVPCFPLLGLTPSGLFMGLSSTIIYTSELILWFHYLYFVLVCFVLFLFFPASPSRKVAFRITSCDLLYMFMRAHMCMRIVVVSPSGFRCSVTFLALYLLGTILNNWFFTFSMLTPLIILANSADGIIQYLIRYIGAGECYFRF